MDVVCVVCALIPLILCFHHVFVVLVCEVKGRQDGLEPVENLIVLGHVSGQNTSAGNTGEKQHLLELCKQHHVYAGVQEDDLT